MPELSVSLATMPGWPELLVIAIIALLIFGRRLPDVARSVGKSIVEFKRGLKDVKDDLDSAGNNEEPTKSLPKSSESKPAESSARSNGE